MYKLKSTIRCPKEMQDSFLERLRKIGVADLEIETVPYAKFIGESRMYWDYAYPEMLYDQKDVVYLNFTFDDSPDGRKFCHTCEAKIGWVPQNIRYIEV